MPLGTHATRGHAPRRQEEETPLTVSKPELLSDESDARFRQLVHNLLAFSARLESIRSRFGNYLGLTGIQYTILISIRHLEGAEGVGVKALAEHLGLSGAFVTIETGKLIKEDLLVKRPNPVDRRRVLLSVSYKGRSWLARLAPVQREVNDLIFEALDEERFDALCNEAAMLRHNGERAIALAEYLLSDTRDNEDE